ncbi:MAG: DUF1798 family protein [Bacillaceae bacterium]|nr:DUF1798 family protein [Bacillaceae bacterium]
MTIYEIMERLEMDLLKEGLKRYEQSVPADRNDREAFVNIKQETEPVFQLIENWETAVSHLIDELPIYPNQAANTKDNMELFLMHSYYHDVPKKRFMELYHSILYVFNQIKEQQAAK